MKLTVHYPTLSEIGGCGLQGIQPGIDQTEAGTTKDPHHSMGSEAAVNKPGSGITGATGAAGREQLAPKEPVVHIRGPEVIHFLTIAGLFIFRGKVYLHIGLIVLC